MSKFYYKGKEVLDVTTYNQHEKGTVEIDIDVLLKNGDMRTVSIKNPIGRKKFDKGYVARRMGIKTGIYEHQEIISGWFNENYIFDDSEAFKFLLDTEIINECERVEESDLLELLQQTTQGFSQNSVLRQNILIALKQAYYLGTKK